MPVEIRDNEIHLSTRELVFQIDYSVSLPFLQISKKA
jgi:hypothetical protein